MDGGNKGETGGIWKWNGNGSGIKLMVCLFLVVQFAFLAFEAWRFAVSCLYVCVSEFNPMLRCCERKYYSASSLEFNAHDMR